MIYRWSFTAAAAVGASDHYSGACARQQEGHSTYTSERTTTTTTKDRYKAEASLIHGRFIGFAIVPWQNHRMRRCLLLLLAVAMDSRTRAGMQPCVMLGHFSSVTTIQTTYERSNYCVIIGCKTEQAMDGSRSMKPNELLRVSQCLSLLLLVAAAAATYARV